jgi:hypothetical protein
VRTPEALRPGRQTPAAKHYVTIRQAVEERPFLTERWLRRAVAEKRIPYAKAGGILLFALEDIDQFVEARRIEPVS